jgi:hypothetical protein
MLKLSNSQQIIMNFIKEQKVKRVYIGVTVKAECFEGWEWYQIERPLNGLVKRGILNVSNNCFYSINEEYK